jgi:spore germination protein GerM
MRSNIVLAVGVAAVLGIGGGVLLNSNQRADTPAAPTGRLDVVEQGVAPPSSSPNVVKPHGRDKKIELTYYVLHDTQDDVVLAPRTVPLIVQGAAAPWRMAHTALTAMENFPRTDGSDRSPIPEGGHILGVHIAPDGLATVNVSQSFQDNFNGGAREEQMTIYAIVNTVGHMPTVKGVEFEVQGKRVDEFAGHIDLTDPLAPDDTIVEKPK